MGTVWTFVDEGGGGIDEKMVETVMLSGKIGFCFKVAKFSV